MLTRDDPAIDFDWGAGSPSGAVNVDNFSAEWNGTLTAPSAGNYTFRLKADDGAELFINGTSVINQPNYSGNAYQTSGVISLSAGQSFTVKLQFREDGGNAGVQLQWQRPGDTSFSTIGSQTASLYLGATPYTGTAVNGGTVYEAFVRARVCDPTQGVTYLETNCVAYTPNAGNTLYKPEGLLQRYSKKVRYSVLGYLNDDNLRRDGGVLRAQQKFVAPLKPVPGSPDAVNTAAEWSATDGTYVRNPDSAECRRYGRHHGRLPPSAAVVDSGVINYLNKFGEITPGTYKYFDPVSELYYAAIRYFKNLPNVPEWTAVPSGTSTSTRITWTDGFPVITAPVRSNPVLVPAQLRARHRRCQHQCRQEPPRQHPDGQRAQPAPGGRRRPDQRSRCDQPGRLCSKGWDRRSARATATAVAATTTRR